LPEPATLKNKRRKIEMTSTKQVPSNLKGFDLAKLREEYPGAEIPPEIEGASYVIVDTHEPIQSGKFVLGIKNGFPAIWRYDLENKGDFVEGRVTQSGYRLKEL
jgi:hypothetical protein